MIYEGASGFRLSHNVFQVYIISQILHHPKNDVLTVRAIRKLVYGICSFALIQHDLT